MTASKSKSVRALTWAAAIAVATAGCGNTGVGGGSTSAAPPPGCVADPQGISFDASLTGRALPDVFVPPDGPAPPCAGFWLTSQRLDLSAWGTAFPRGVEKRVGVCVTRGTWGGRLKPGILMLDGSCGRGPDSPDVTIRFALDYAGDFDRADPAQPPEACMFRSGMNITRFDMSGLDHLDDFVRRQVEGDLFAQVDREATDQVNQRMPLEGVTSGTALPADRTGRCSDWSRVDLPLP